MVPIAMEVVDDAAEELPWAESWQEDWQEGDEEEGWGGGEGGGIHLRLESEELKQGEAVVDLANEEEEESGALL